MYSSSPTKTIDTEHAKFVRYINRPKIVSQFYQGRCGYCDTNSNFHFCTECHKEITAEFCALTHATCSNCK